MPVWSLRLVIQLCSARPEQPSEYSRVWQTTGQTWGKSGLPSVFVNKSLLEHRYAHFCVLSMAASIPQQSMKLKIFVLWPFIEKVFWPLVYRLIFRNYWGHIFVSPQPDALYIMKFLHFRCWECELFVTLDELWEWFCLVLSDGSFSSLRCFPYIHVLMSTWVKLLKNCSSFSAAFSSLILSLAHFHLPCSSQILNSYLLNFRRPLSSAWFSPPCTAVLSFSRQQAGTITGPTLFASLC